MTADGSPRGAALRPNLRGRTITITVEDGYYLKAYATDPETHDAYGFQATISRKGVRDSLLQIVDDFLEDNRDV